MKVVPVPCREDNYAYLLIDDATKEAAAIDPYDVQKVADQAKQEGISKITSILTTHHHFDHAGGNREFVGKFPGVTVYGGSDEVEAITKIVKDGDQLQIGSNISIKCMATPCHTQDSICYYVTNQKDGSQKGVFTGDTLFIAGCGRFFEGTGEEMHRALSYLGSLPDDTLVYNGHEYTASNLKFAAHIEPNNADIKNFQAGASDVTTGKSTIGDEKKINVFMRLDNEDVRKATGEKDPNAVISKLREMKNKF